MKVREKADDIFLKALGNRIATIRKEKHITQIELSYRCDIEKTNMRRIEAGNTNPTILMLKKICNGLGISLPELLEFTTETAE
jgi:transcriptional regulator with XRE-family HTH domain